MNSGDTCGHYTIVGPLGKGGMGEVYVAEDRKLQRKVALKLLPAVFAADPDRRRRFEREAQAIAALNHPGIVTIHSVETDGPVPFLTMEYIEGRTLRETIPKGGATVDTLLRTTIGIADAVAAAHERGIVHRDLKPANVIVCPDGRVKVLDFGLAKIHEAKQTAAGDASTQMFKDDLTGEGRIVGTVAYMSPEQAEGKPVDQRSDIFSLGVMLHEIATGDRPFHGDTEISIISSIIKDTPAAVTELRPDLPVPLARIVKRCLAKDPLKRYQSARDLHNDLEDLRQDVESGVLSSPSAGRPDVPPQRGRRIPTLTIYVGAAALLAIAAAAGWWAYGGHPAAARAFVAGDFTRLTDSGTASLAALSPDGRYVVHLKGDAGGSGLWVRQTATPSDVAIVPPTDGRFDGVSFSPDANYIYYNLYPRGSGVATLHRVPVLGGASTRVIEDVDSGVSFSPDGKQFTYVRGRPTESSYMLMVANADGSGVRQLVGSKPPFVFASDTAPWSPDGRTVIVTGQGVNPGDKTRLVSIDVATGSATPFGGDWEYLHGVAWMPDGRSVIVGAIASAQTQYAQLWQIGWPGGGRQSVTSGVNGYEGVSVSADGRTIATIEGEGHSNIWTQPLAGGAGRQMTAAVRGTVGGGGIAWTPDGRLLYSTISGTALNQIWIMDADGRNVRQLTTMDDFAAWPTASPDGKWILFSGGHGGTSIYKMPMNGGDPVRLTTGALEYHPIASADSQWVYFTSAGQGARNRAMKVSIDGGAATPLTEPELLFSPSSLWAGGARLFGYGWNPANRRTEAVTISVEGGPAEFMPNAPPRAVPLPDGKAWLLADRRNGAGGLFARPIPAGADRLLVSLGDDQVWRVAVSADSRNVALVRGRTTNDVVLIKAK